MKERYEIFESSQDMLICELDKLVQKQELTPQILSYLDTLVDIIKDLDEIIANEDAKYEGYNNSYRSYPSARMNDRGYSYRNGYRENPSYSRRSEKTSDMLDHLYKAYDSAVTEDEKKRVKRMIDEIEHS